MSRFAKNRRGLASEKTNYHGNDEGRGHAHGSDVELGCPVEMGCQIHRSPLPREGLIPSEWIGRLSNLRCPEKHLQGARGHFADFTEWLTNG